MRNPADEIQWPEQARIPDNLFARAYETCPASFRAAIKTAIAIHYHHYGQPADKEERKTVSARLGLSARRSAEPCAWTFIGCDPACGAAVLTAGCMLPILANVGHIAAFCMGEPSDAFLLVMELCGIENTFQSDAKTCLDFCRRLSPDSENGRILLLHEGALDSMARELEASGLVSFNERHRLAGITERREREELELLRFCLGHEPISGSDTDEKADILYRGQFQGQDALSHNRHYLELDKGCEGVWIFPRLAPEAFLKTSCRYSLIHSI